MLASMAKSVDGMAKSATASVSSASATVAAGASSASVAVAAGASSASASVAAGAASAEDFLAVEKDDTVVGEPDPEGRYLLYSCGVRVNNEPYSLRVVADGDRCAALHLVDDASRGLSCFLDELTQIRATGPHYVAVPEEGGAVIFDITGADALGNVDEARRQEDVARVDRLLALFSVFERADATTEDAPEEEEKAGPNAVAVGIEHAGQLAASIIVGGAKLSAKAIRGAGHQVAKLSTPKEATDAQIAKDEAAARRLKESALRAEQAAGGVANLAMAPVRVIGEAAATGAQAASARFGATTGAGAPAKPPSALARAAGAATTATLEVVGAAGYA